MLSYSFGPHLERPPEGASSPRVCELPKVDPPCLASSFQLPNFLQISHKPPRASGAWRHPHPVTPFRQRLWHLWVARPPRARVTTYIKVCTLLTHVLSRKVPSLTKLKGMNQNPLAITLYSCHTKIWRFVVSQNPREDFVLCIFNFLLL